MTDIVQPDCARQISRRPFSAADWPLWLSVAVLAVPTIISLGRQVWSTEAGAHGPIVLAVSAWLLIQGLSSVQGAACRGSMYLVLLGLLIALPLYTFGRAYDFISLEVAGLYGAFVAILYSRMGASALVKRWFPIVYLAFLVPAPGWFLDDITAPLKQFASWASMNVLGWAGLPISREGVTLYVGSYRLLVEDACSGMNSIVGLIAVSLLYIYLLRGSNARYAALLVVSTIPIAVVGNILRIMTLIALTYFLGDEVAQGFMHTLAGVFLFAVDLIMVFLLDVLLWKLLPESWKSNDRPA